MRKNRSKKLTKAKGKKVQNRDLSRNDKEAVKAILQGVEIKCAKMDKKSVEGDIEAGRDLIKAEKILFGKGQSKRGKWGEYLEQFDSELKPRTIQRYIQLAKNVDLEEHPNLAYLGQANLLKLIQLGDRKKTPAEVLDDGEVELEFDAKDADARKIFRVDSAKLISKLDTERRESKKKESPKELGMGLAQTLRKMNKLLSQPEELEGFKDFLEGDEELQAINKSVRVKLRKLPPKITKTSKTPRKSLTRSRVKPKKVSATR